MCREKEIYGEESLGGIERYTNKKLKGTGASLDWYQSNSEFKILEKLQNITEYDGVVINPGALSHSSFALYDCLRSVACRVVEVHLTNTHRREHFRTDRLSAKACDGIIEGLEKKFIIWEYYGFCLKSREVNGCIKQQIFVTV